MKTNKSKGENKIGSKSAESTLNKAVKNVKEILKSTEGPKEVKKKAGKSSKEENIIKISSDSPAAAAILKSSPRGSKAKSSKLKSLDSEGSSERGVVYLGHIPHGFYEDQMKKFFSQFGKVTNVRVSRSKVSGKPRGYGFVEFLHPEVAKVAAESMHNYLMFGRLVKAEFIPPERQHGWYFRGLPYSARSFPRLWNRRAQVQKTNGKPQSANDLESILDKSQGEKTREEKSLEVRKKLRGLSVLAGKLRNKGVKIDMKLGDVSI